MWICPKCATHHDDEAQVCPVCGLRRLSGAEGGHVPEYPVPVDPWAAHADTQTALTPVDHAPAPVSPSSGGPRSPGSFTPSPASTRPLSGPVVPAPQPTRHHPMGPGPTRPATIEVTQRNGVPLRWVVTMAAVFVAGVGVAAAIAVPRLLSDHHTGTPTPTASGPSSTPSPSGSSGGGLVVAIAPDLTDGRADEVVAMLDVYFNGINAKDYPAVGTVLDPDGTTDPDDEDDMAELADGTRSTQDSNITLTSLDDVGHGVLSAEVTFRSNQTAGDGPADRPDETCTQWDITYTLSHHDAYRIEQSDATSQPC